MQFLRDRSLLLLSIASFASGLAIGYVKFYLLGHLAELEHRPEDKSWIIQAVGALITIGPFLSFVVGGPLATAFSKGSMMALSGISTAILMAIGVLTDWAGSGWLYVFLSGLGLGLFNAARNSAIPLEAARDHVSTEYVNACVNNLYILGLLLGVPLGTELFYDAPWIGAWLSSILFLVCGIAGLGCFLPNETAHLRPVGESFRFLKGECSFILRRFPLYLLISPMLWGIAGALSLAATAFVEECNFAGPFMASLMSVYAAAGVVIGNFQATRYVDCRFRATMYATLVLGIAIGGIPVIGLASETLQGIEWVGYAAIAALLLVCGFTFGLATNLVEAEYLTKLCEEEHEGTGAALLSALTSFWAFLLGGIAAISVYTGVLTSSTQFIALAASTCIVAAFVKRLEDKIKARSV